MTLLHDTVYSGQSQAGAAPCAFGGKERLEDARQRLLIDPRAGIGDAQADIFAGRDLPAECGKVVLREGDVARLDEEQAALLHRVARVHA